mgnify:FL=1
MSELQDKLNSLLSDPAGMAQVVQLAQQLSSTMEPSAAPTPQSGAPTPPPSPNPPPSTALPGGIDLSTVSRFLPMLQALSSDQSHSMQLLNALRPYLKEEKQGKVERAARLARLITVGKRFLTEWEG